MSIQIRNLRFAYENFTLRVDHLDFEKAKITSIVGPNGAGKTTLLKCIGAILPPRGESLYIEGTNVADMKGHERAQRVCYVPQEHGSVFNYSVLDFVLMGRAAYLSPFSSPSKKDRRIAEEALEFVGMAGFISRHLFELSSGERRLILIARALAQQADILLLDEPTTFLDPKHEIELLQLTKKLSEEMGKTLVLTLHNLEMAVEYSDEMVFMKAGSIIASGNPDEILTEALLEKVYDLRMKIVESNGYKFIKKGDAPQRDTFDKKKKHRG